MLVVLQINMRRVEKIRIRGGKKVLQCRVETRVDEDTKSREMAGKIDQQENCESISQR